MRGLAVLVLALLTSGWTAPSTQSTPLTVHVFDIGAGLCTVTEIPRSGGVEYFVYDAGGATYSMTRCINEIKRVVPDSHEIELMILPGVGFSLDGARLGQGGGYYDRTLRAARSRAKAPLGVGVGFEAQIVANLPVTPSDESVDVLVTEKRLVYCRAVSG